MAELKNAPGRAERRLPRGWRPQAAPVPASRRDAPPVAAPVAPLVSVRGLRYAYPDGTAVDYGDVPLEIGPGERAVLLGPNGAGKSTLLLHVLGLLKAQAGEVRVFGRAADTLPPAERAQMAALLQNVDEQIIGPTVWDDVAFTPRNLGLAPADVDRLVEGALRRLDIWALRERVPHALSVGERRKVALAGAIVFSAGRDFGPRILVMDEPFASLDPRSRAGLIELIDELRRDHGTAVLLSTHWVHAVPEFADRVFVLAPGGRIVAGGTPEEVFARPELLEALDIEPPVLSQLFRSLERRGVHIPPALTVERAADVLASHCRSGGRLLGNGDAGRRVSGRRPTGTGRGR
jgi:cobalt/nickel transport system ATP-binding protein